MQTHTKSLRAYPRPLSSKLLSMGKMRSTSGMPVSVHVTSLKLSLYIAGAAS
jgi:hypothetical protein